MNTPAPSMRLRMLVAILVVTLGAGIFFYYSYTKKQSSPSDAQKVAEIKKGFGAYLSERAKTEQVTSAEFTASQNATLPSGWETYQFNKKVDYKAFQNLGGSIEKSNAKYIYQSSLSIRLPKDTAFRQTLSLKEKDRYLLNAYLKVHSGKATLIYQLSGTKDIYTQALTPNSDNSWQTVGKSLQVEHTPQEAMISLVADEDTNLTLNFITVQPISGKKSIEGFEGTNGFFLDDDGEWQPIQSELSPQTYGSPNNHTSYSNVFKDLIDIGVVAQSDRMDVPVRVMISTQAYSYIATGADFANPMVRNPSTMLENAFVVWETYHLQKRLVVAPIIEFDETNPLYNVCPLEVTKGFGFVSAFGLAPAEYCDAAPPLTYLIKTPREDKYLRFSESNALVGGNIYIGPGIFQSQQDLTYTIMHETSHAFFRAHYDDAYTVMRNDVNGRTYVSPYRGDYLGSDDGSNNAMLEHTRLQIAQAGLNPLGGYDAGPKTNDIPTTLKLTVGNRPLANAQYTMYPNSSPFEILFAKHKPSHILNLPAIRANGTTDVNGILTLSSTSWPTISYVNLLMAFSPAENKWYYGWVDTAVGNIKKWSGVSQWDIAMVEDPGPDIQITYPRDGMVIDQINNRFELRGLIDARDIKSYEVFIDNQSVAGGDTAPESDLLSQVIVTRGIAPGNHTYKVEVTKNFLNQKVSKSVNFTWAPPANNVTDCSTDKMDVCLRYQAEGRACQWYACGKGICQPDFAAPPQQCTSIEIVKPLGLPGPRKAERMSLGSSSLRQTSNTNERYLEWRPLNQQFYPYPLELRITHVASGVESYSLLFIAPGTTNVEISEQEWSQLKSGEQYVWRLCAYPRIDSEDPICASDEFTKSGRVAPSGQIQCNTSCVYSENNKCYIGRCTSGDCGTNRHCEYGGAACGYGPSEEVACEDTSHNEPEHTIPSYIPFNYTPIQPIANPPSLQVTVRNTASSAHGISTIGFALYKNGNEFVQDLLSFPNSTNTYAIDLPYMDPDTTYRIEPRAKSMVGAGNDINTVTKEVVRCNGQTTSQPDCSIRGGGIVEMVIRDSGQPIGGNIPSSTPIPQSGRVVVTVLNNAQDSQFGVDRFGVALYKRVHGEWQWIEDKLSNPISQGGPRDLFDEVLTLPDISLEYKLEPRAKNISGEDIQERPGGVMKRVYNDNRPSNGGYACTGTLDTPQTPKNCIVRGTDNTGNTAQSFEIRPIAAPTATPAFVAGGRAAIRIAVHLSPYLHPIAKFGFKVEKNVDGQWIPEIRGTDPNYIDASHPGEVMTEFRGIESGNETQTIYQDMDRRYEYRFSAIARTRDGNLFNAQDVRFGASMCREQFQTSPYCIIPGTADQNDAVSPATAFLYIDWTPPTPTFNPTRITCRANGWPKTVRPGVPFTASFTLNNPTSNADSVLFSLRGFSLPAGFAGPLLVEQPPQQWVNIPARQSVEHTVLLTVNSTVPRGVYGISWDTSTTGDGDCLDTQGNSSLTLAVDPNAPLPTAGTQPIVRPTATSTPRISSPTPQPTVSSLGSISQVTTACQQYGFNFSYAPVQGADFYGMTLDRLDTPRSRRVSNDSAQNLCAGSSCTQPIDAPHGVVYGNLEITASGNGQSRRSQFGERYYCPVEENACSFTQTTKLQDKFGNPLSLHASVHRSYNTSTLYLPAVPRRTDVPLPSIAFQQNTASVTENLVADRQRGEERNRLILPAHYKVVDSQCTSDDASVCIRRDLEEPSATLYPVCSTSVEYTWSLACTQFSSAFTVEPAAGESITAADMQHVRVSIEKVNSAGETHAVGQWPMAVDTNGRSTLSWNPSELPVEINGVRLLLGEQIRARLVLPQAYRTLSGTGGTFDPATGSVTFPLQCASTVAVNWTIEKFSPKLWNIKPQTVCRREGGRLEQVDSPLLVYDLYQVGANGNVAMHGPSLEEGVTYTVSNTRTNQQISFGLLWLIRLQEDRLTPVNLPAGISVATKTVSLDLVGGSTIDIQVPFATWNSDTLPQGEIPLQFELPQTWCDRSDADKASDETQNEALNLNEPLTIINKDTFPLSNGSVGLGSVRFMSSEPLRAGGEVNLILPDLSDETGIEKVAVYIKKQGLSGGKFNLPNRWEILTIVNCQQQDCTRGIQSVTLPKDLQAGTYDVALMIADHAKAQNGQHIGIVSSSFVKGTPFDSSTKPCTEATETSTYCTAEGLSTTVSIGSARL